MSNVKVLWTDENFAFLKPCLDQFQDLTKLQSLPQTKNGVNKEPMSDVKRSIEAEVEVKTSSSVLATPPVPQPQPHFMKWHKMS